MELWEKVLAAKNAAEAKFPLSDRHAGSEQRDMEVFIAMVHAAIDGGDEGQAAIGGVQPPPPNPVYEDEE